MRIQNNSISLEHRQAMSIDGAARLVSVLMDEERFKAPTVPPGAPVIEGYNLESLLGRGAGGDVYLGFRELDCEPVAIKVIARASDSAAMVKRAWRELDVLSELRIPGVPRVLDYGSIDGTVYMVTTLVEGSMLDEHCTIKGLDDRQRLELLIVIADLVQAVNERGVIHRDLKPSNILVEADGTPVLIDFGLAWRDQLNDEHITMSGNPIGTLGFMPPEQARGEHEQVSIRSDVYALGAITCYLLTGSTPHDVNVAAHEAIRRVAQTPPRDPRMLRPNLPKSLAEIIARATAESPSERYASAAFLADDLRSYLKNEPIPWQKTNVFHRQRLAWRRNRGRYLATVGIWALVLTTFVTTTFAASEHRTAEAARANAQEASRLKDEAEALAQKQTEFAVHWEQEAREREAWRIEIEALEQKRIALRERQKARVQLAIDQGQLFDASIVLLNFAEELKELRPSDQEMLNIFIEKLNALVDAAVKQSAPSP